MNNPTHVVAGILRDSQGRVLIAQRPPGKHLAGLWEFPGGKCEPGEAPDAALHRELHEELGIEFDACDALIAVPWQYPETSVLLDVRTVRTWHGTAHGREGQALRWVHVDALATIPMPAADRPVIAALRLPDCYAITPEPSANRESFVRDIALALDGGVRCLQLRAKRADAMQLREILSSVCALAEHANAIVLINSHIDLAEEFGIGVHLTAAQLMRTSTRPLPADRWLAASCHDARELAHAAAIGVDFVVAGPVLPTASHAGAPILGWDGFAALCADAPFPVYALGGMTRSDIGAARSAGAQGIAGISAFWPAR